MNVDCYKETLTVTCHDFLSAPFHVQSECNTESQRFFVKLTFKSGLRDHMGTKFVNKFKGGLKSRLKTIKKTKNTIL